MSIVRQIGCDIDDCSARATEATHGDGWQGWGMLAGKQEESAAGEITSTELNLCPDHLSMIFGYIRNLSGENK